MNILILGSGGREHAFAWKMAQSPRCRGLFVAPGNAGTASVATNLPIGVNEFERLAEAALRHQIDLIVVGPEEPLVRGIRDYFEEHEALRHIRLLGPGADGARLEGSKDFSKGFMQRHGIPTAASRTFTRFELAEGLEYLKHHSLPVVLKADGLAAGKGVVIAETTGEAEAALGEMLVEGKFGAAGNKVVVEAFLSGIELSVFVLTDGMHYQVLPEAKDYKRVGENDTGLNTGGMGAVSPVPFADATFMRKVEERAIRPTLDGLRAEGISYVGFLFFGLMNVRGEPYVIEYNARMGDPETEVVIPRIQSDLVDLLLAAATGNLHRVSVRVDARAAATVMLVSGGYPEAYQKGKPISGHRETGPVTVFHAGTRLDPRGEIVTDGGRVMAVTALAPSLEEALRHAQQAARLIEYDNKYFRKDIGWEFVGKEFRSL
ncbi:MAG: phosphoribosylamine--glycine ligase [Ferruginibacter sp.]|nr:phosphoribosylamine--glycine ligase [Cytophagales bacterium]